MRLSLGVLFPSGQWRVGHIVPILEQSDTTNAKNEFKVTSSRDIKGKHKSALKRGIQLSIKRVTLVVRRCLFECNCGS